MIVSVRKDAKMANVLSDDCVQSFENVLYGYCM